MQPFEENARRKSLEDLMAAMGQDDVQRVPAFASQMAERNPPDGGMEQLFGDREMDPRVMELLQRKKMGMGGNAAPGGM